MPTNTRRLFHFTTFLNLPDVLCNGITEGEVPTGPVPIGERPNAANLTSNGDPLDQLVWMIRRPLKLLVRLSVEISESELTTFDAVIDRYQISENWLNIIDPDGHREHWFFAFDGVKPEQIVQVDRLTETGYQQLFNNELSALVRDIDSEKAKKWEEYRVTEGIEAGARGYRLKPGFDESWLKKLPEWLQQNIQRKLLPLEVEFIISFLKEKGLPVVPVKEAIQLATSHPDFVGDLKSAVTAWLNYHGKYLEGQFLPDDEEKKLINALIVISTGATDIARFGVPEDVGRKLLDCYDELGEE